MPIYRCGSDGGFVFGTNAVLTGEGVLEFSGGTGHELPKETNQVVAPLVKVSGHGVVTFAGEQLAFGRGLTVMVSMIPLFLGKTGYRMDGLDSSPVSKENRVARNTHPFVFWGRIYLCTHVRATD